MDGYHNGKIDDPKTCNLIFGSCSIENWSAIEAQLLHSFYLFGLFWFYEKFKTEESSL